MTFSTNRKEKPISVLFFGFYIVENVICCVIIMLGVMNITSMGENYE